MSENCWFVISLDYRICVENSSDHLLQSPEGTGILMGILGYEMKHSTGANRNNNEFLGRVAD